MVQGYGATERGLLLLDMLDWIHPLVFSDFKVTCLADVGVEYVGAAGAVAGEPPAREGILRHEVLTALLAGDLPKLV